MGYDDQLVARIRELIGIERGVQERKMFGHHAFLIGGNLAIAVSGEGDVLVRVRPDESHDIASTSTAELAVMNGRRMTGWLHVASEHVTTKRHLERWVKLGAARARSLPAKT